MEPDIIHNEYFSNYEDLEVHRLMLEDEPRTDAYRQAILGNDSFFKNKIVMDVGCGTGILSLFCAQAGAKKVYAVEASNLATLAKEIAKDNNYSDVIEVIHSKVEDVVLPDNIKVDAIVSEWMGFYLLHEGMLNSVLEARDKFLKKDGLMFPETASIYVAPCRVPSLFDKWNDFHGASLKTYAKHLRVKKCEKPEIMQIEPENVIADDVVVAWIDLREDTVESLNTFSVQHIVGAKKTGTYQGICIWFDCTFPKPPNKDPVVLSTHPDSPLTHWKQTVIIFPEEQHVEEQEPIAFQLDLNRDEDNTRRYNITITLLDPEKVEHPVPCSCYMTKCIVLKTVMDQQVEHMKHNSAENTVLQEENIDDDDE